MSAPRPVPTMRAHGYEFTAGPLREALDMLARSAAYAPIARRRNEHRSKMRWASISPYAPPRYYITRAGSETFPWYVERVYQGGTRAVGERPTHAAAIALVQEWIRADMERAR